MPDDLAEKIMDEAAGTTARNVRGPGKKKSEKWGWVEDLRPKQDKILRVEDGYPLNTVSSYLRNVTFRSGGLKKFKVDPQRGDDGKVTSIIVTRLNQPLTQTQT